jgi:hypothetical protein
VLPGRKTWADRPPQHCDTRLGGLKKYILGTPDDAKMRIPEAITSCVCFLCVKQQPGANAGKYQPAGTGVFVGVKMEGDYSFVYLVTARHVVDTIEECGFKEMYARINTHTGTYEYIQVNLDAWITSTNKAIDLAVLRFGIDQKIFNFKPLPFEMLATTETVAKHGIGIGDELFAVGLFALREGKERNIPIVRTGIVAAMPDEPLTNKTGDQYHAYLAELRSIGGLSGSPVFVWIDRFRCVNPGLEEAKDWAFFLLGLIQGHWDLQKNATSDLLAPDAPFISKGENLNVGIAVVTPAQYLVALLMAETLQQEREAIRKTQEEENMPTED